MVDEQQLCGKTHFGTALDDICSCFTSISDGEINGMLDALEVQSPAALVNYFEKFIDEMRKFCQE